MHQVAYPRHNLKQHIDGSEAFGEAFLLAVSTRFYLRVLSLLLHGLVLVVFVVVRGE